MLKKNYINHDERQRWLQMVYLGEALDKVIESKTDYGKAKSDLKRGRTYILKAIEEFGEIYPKVIKTILNDTGYYDMSFLPKSQSRKVYEKYLDSEKLKAMGDPLEQLYDVLDIVIPKVCKGCCEIGGKCELRATLEHYNIPTLDDSDKLCKYRY